MDNTTYESLAAALFNKIKDYDFASMDESTANSIVINYIPKACVMFESCGQNLEDRDDELRQFNFELSKTNFEILCNFMLIAYLDAEYLCVPNMLKPRLSPSDFKSLQLPQQLDKVMELRSMLKSENDQLAINKSYKDSELFNIVVNRTSRHYRKKV